MRFHSLAIGNPRPEKALAHLSAETATTRRKKKNVNGKGGGMAGLISLVLGVIKVSKWVWLKIKGPGIRRGWSLVPFTRDPFWVPIFDPHPNGGVLNFPLPLRG